MPINSSTYLLYLSLASSQPCFMHLTFAIKRLYYLTKITRVCIKVLVFQAKILNHNGMHGHEAGSTNYKGSKYYCLGN